MLMLTGIIVLAMVWFGVALPLAYLYGKWQFRNWDTLTEREQRERLGLPLMTEAEIEALLKPACADRVEHERREARQIKAERRWKAKQRLNMERWVAIGRETARRTQPENIKQRISLL